MDVEPKPELPRLRAGAAERLLGWVRAAAPYEACGLLLRSAGSSRSSAAPGLEVALVPNRLDPPAAERAFELEPGAWVAAEDAARARGLELAGFWHSHPSGPAAPSARDLAAAEPGSLHVVVALEPVASIEAWWCAGDRFEALGPLD